MKDKQETEALRALMQSIATDVLTSNVSDEDIEAEIREEGGDPDAVGRRGAELARELLANRRAGEQRMTVSRAAIRTARTIPNARRQLLLSEIEAGRADPRFAEVLAARRGRLDEASEDDLWALAAELKRLKGEPISE
jgi:hypothetical protein